MNKLTPTSAKKLESILWSSMEEWVSKGGHLKDSHWGIKWHPKKKMWVMSGETYPEYAKCCCAFGSTFLCPPSSKSIVKAMNDGKKHSGNPEMACELLFGLDNDEVNALTGGFDLPTETATRVISNMKNNSVKDPINDVDTYIQYFNVGQNLRKRAQKLGPTVWKGSKG